MPVRRSPPTPGRALVFFVASFAMIQFADPGVGVGRVVERRPEPRQGHRTAEGVTTKLTDPARDCEPAT
jgi:hypothetical protein